MKTLSTALRLLLATAAFGALTSIATAGPGVQQWKTMNSESQFKEMKAGSKVAYVCTGCKTVSEMTIGSSEKAMELCKDGGSVECPACKKVAKVVIKRERNAPANHTEITYVDAKGEPCAFIAMVPSKM